MPTLDRESFRKIVDRPIVEVDMGAFSGWEGITVLLRAMDGTRRRVFELHYADMPKGEKLPEFYREMLLRECIVSPDGELVFTDDEALVEMAEKNSAALDLLYQRALKMNGLEVKSVEEAAKN
jgi:hypothetical protein